MDFGNLLLKTSTINLCEADHILNIPNIRISRDISPGTQLTINTQNIAQIPELQRL